MHFQRSITAISALTALTAAAPHPSFEVDTPTRVERRQEASTYTCVLVAAATNGEYGNGFIPRRSLDDVIGKRQGFTDPSSDGDDFPSAGSTVAPNTFISGEGITLGIAGATQPLWSDAGFNVWLGTNSQTISASDTGLPNDIVYSFAGPGVPSFSCSISYNGVDYPCSDDADISLGFDSSYSVQTGTAEFPCVLTPPGTTGSETYAPGWCTTHVVQYQKPDPATDPYTLDVSLFDGAGTPIGAITGAISSTALTSLLPYTFDVGTENVDSDPVTFAYAGDSWDSNDSTNHQCSVGAYDSGSRQIDCGFTC